MSTTPSIARLLKPRSIAVVGASPDPASVGGRVLAHLEAFGFAGEVHLVNPGRKEINGRPCLAAIDDLPLDVDAVVLAIPQAAIRDAVAACVRRQAGAAVVFASGFAEVGESGVAEQQAISAMAREAGMALVGPNCMGLANYADRVPLSFGPTEALSYDGGPAVGIVAQSGGIAGHIRVALRAHGVDVSYSISTGNEAVLGVEDFLDHLVDDECTQAIAIFAEQLRQPQRFLAAARNAKSRRKPIVMLHTGRSAQAREAARTHTGAMTSDYAVMRTLVAHEAVVLVDSLEELVDVAELLVRFPQAATAGPGIITDSGAFKSFALDFCDELGLDLPQLSAEAKDAVTKVLPPFTAASNPLDITTQGLTAMALYDTTGRTLLGDAGLGGLIAAVLPGTPAIGLAKMRALLPALSNATKPAIVVALGGDHPVADELPAMLRAQRIPFFRSAERALRAMAHVVSYGRAVHVDAAATTLPSVQVPAETTMPEHLSKAILAKAGIAVPKGTLARSRAEAEKAAAVIGYPVALKAQAADLAHKSDVGGVALAVASATRLRQAWTRVNRDVGRARPELKLDGILVEAMGTGGIEMVVGARRDPDWGVVLMVGLGGIWVEALRDVRLLPADLDEQRIVAEIGKLRGAALLAGLRGQPPADIEALAAVIARVGALMRATPAIVEIDINPVAVYPRGKGAVALDALIVTA
jgi:acetate---CoA ligase (ADP-forming)